MSDPTPKTVMQSLASTLQALRNCEKRARVGSATNALPWTKSDESGDPAPVNTWQDRHRERLTRIERECLPSGSGVDAGSSIDLVKSKPARIVLTLSFHHMNDAGYYDGWSDHTVILTPSFDGFDLRITGRDRNGIKDYLGDIFYHALSSPIGF